MFYVFLDYMAYYNAYFFYAQPLKRLLVIVILMNHL